MENYVLPISVLPNRGQKRIYLTNIKTAKEQFLKCPYFLAGRYMGIFRKYPIDNYDRRNTTIIEGHHSILSS